MYDGLLPFTPGEPLGAAQLERWLAAQRAASEPDRAACHGVDAFDLRRSMRCRYEGEHVCVDVRRVRGTTPDRATIVLGDGESLESRVGVDGAGTAVFDAFVELHRPGLEPAIDRTRALGLLLRDARTAPALEPAREGELFLGRFECRRAASERTALAWIARPPVRRLAALEPHDEAWRAWTQPLANKLGAWSERALATQLKPSGLAVAFAAALGRLCTIWSVLDVSELWRELAAVARLSRANRARAADVVEALHPSPLEPYRARPATGEEQVAALCSAVERIDQADGTERQLSAGGEVHWQWLSDDRVACKLENVAAAARGLTLRFPSSAGLSRRMAVRCSRPSWLIPLDARDRGEWLDFEVPANQLRGVEELTLSGLRAGPHARPDLELWVHGT